MASLRKTLLLAVLGALMVPAAASAAKPQLQPLVDRVPLGTQFKDRFFTSSARTARVAVSGTWNAYPIKSGQTVSAAISDRYGNQLSPTVVQTYVDFLDSLDHGPELAQLKIFIAPADEVLAACGRLDVQPADEARRRRQRRGAQGRADALDVGRHEGLQGQLRQARLEYAPVPLRPDARRRAEGAPEGPARRELQPGLHFQRQGRRTDREPGKQRQRGLPGSLPRDPDRTRDRDGEARRG